MVRQGSAGPVAGSQRQGRRLGVGLSQGVLSRSGDQQRLEQHRVPERRDAVPAVAAAGRAGGGDESGRGREPGHGQGTQTGASGRHDARAVRSGRARPDRVPGLRVGAGRTAAQPHWCVGGAVSGTFHPVRAGAEKRVLEGRALSGGPRARQAMTPIPGTVASPDLGPANGSQTPKGDTGMIQTAHTTRTVLTLFTAPDDVQSHRVRLVLAAKGVVYDRVEVPPGKPHDELLSINPYGDTPTLQDRDMVLYGPALVCEYIDERYPHPPLMPVDPLSRARLRLACVRIERDWVPEVANIRAG